MPHYTNGDLNALLEQHRREAKYFPENIVKRLAYQLAHGLKIIHESGMIHRDIKPHNLFLTPEGKSLVIGKSHTSHIRINCNRRLWFSKNSRFNEITIISCWN